MKNVAVTNESHVTGTVVAKTPEAKAQLATLDDVTVRPGTRVKFTTNVRVRNSVLSQRWAVTFISENVSDLVVATNGEISPVVMPIPEKMLLIEHDGNYEAYVGKRLSDGDNKRTTRQTEVAAWLNHNEQIRVAMVHVQETLFEETGPDYYGSVVNQLVRLVSSHEKPVYDVALANKYFRGTVQQATTKKVAGWASEPHSKEETAKKVADVSSFITDMGLSKMLSETEIASMFEKAEELILKQNEKAAHNEQAQAKKGHSTHKRPMRGPVVA